MRVLRTELDPSLRYSVRHNVWPAEARITFARSATKHRISRERSLHVIEHCGLQLVHRYRKPAHSDVRGTSVGKVKKQGKKEDTDDRVLGVTRSGLVITEKVAEQMAEEFEREGFDLSKVERRYVGRPSLGPAGHSPRVSFRVPPDLYKAAWARADKEKRSLSDLAREAFNRYMDS